ncbi:MAG: TlpA disulfide reductase family protein [Alphaproteobacteria bacterium]|jgi:thiol-disulfide isomerase/thioredoxin|nr:TlpA family protein disulfide reductase [Rhodospirillaceae bacterium]MBT6509483.1 TlpA family protein disulfide reductase [Rhodospirillaceae bacterium]MBT7612089.1 TlpA family protein disulfide reductase [Rhodospirillaceae bacterium]MBT7647089.1 TlpA family protein disulfide reductase [Rhodospirillaceae bacterium]MDG2482924.1 TlpA disulfide reductase family protein [Alphaproteobacteria bacterium]
MRFLFAALFLSLAGFVPATPSFAQDAGHPVNLAWLDPPRAVPETSYFVEGEALQSLEVFRGQAVVLNFWATWCPPCVAEMPSLDRLAGAYAGEDLAVVTMAMDRASEEKILAFYLRIGAEHLGIYRDPDMKLAREMRVFGLPTTLLIDHNGQVVAQLVGEAEWDGDSALSAILPLAEAAARARLDVVEQAALAE